MAAWLVYTFNGHGPSPQVLHGDGAKPFLDEGIRRRMWPGEPRPLTAGEIADLEAGHISLNELARRYPAPLVPPRGETSKLTLAGGEAS